MRRAGKSRTEEVMKTIGFRHVYGPVPSRRLGRSLGVDLVPYKTCTFDCIYCQLGRTTNRTLQRRYYVPAEEILEELDRKLSEGNPPDYVTLAGSGEPTLHSGLEEIIRRVKALTSVPVVVLTNGSLLWMTEVRDALMEADVVVPSLDAGDEVGFRKVNRPVAGIRFHQMVEGMISFTRRFSGEVWLEVFLLEGINDSPVEVGKMAKTAQRMGPTRIQLNTVARPPAERFARPVSSDRLQELKALFPGRVEIVCDVAPAGSALSTLSGARDAEIRALLHRRPCTAGDVAAGLGIHMAEVLKHLSCLVDAGEVKAVDVSGDTFYLAVDLLAGSALEPEKTETGKEG